MTESIVINGRSFPVVGHVRGEPVIGPPIAAKKPKSASRIPLQGEAAPSGTLSLSTLPPSLNNAFFNAVVGRVKSPAYKSWIGYSKIELDAQPPWHVAGALRVLILFNRAKTKADLDNLIKPVLDLLVSAGRMSDDRNVMQLSAYFSSDVRGVLIEIQAVRP